jgi:hypothetical protein
LNTTSFQVFLGWFFCYFKYYFTPIIFIYFVK